MEESAPRLVAIGQVSKVHGLAGELKVWPHSQDPRLFTPGARLYFANARGAAPGERVVERVRVHKRHVLLKLKDVNTPERAEEFVGGEVLIARQMLPPPDEDEYYWADLLGCRVLDGQGRQLGRVANIMATAGDDLLVVEDQGRETLIPFRQEMVTQVDPAAGLIRVELPPGMDRQTAEDAD